jgi:hypothetical protein
MTPRTEQTLKQVADYFDLQIEYVADLPDNVPGFLEPSPHPRYIFVNARKTSHDQAFTIAHELAHYIMHTDGRARNLMPWYLRPSVTPRFMVQVSRTAERWMRQKFDVEWQADLWAFMLLWRIGAADDLLAIIKLYPQKNRMFWYSGAATVYTNAKRRILNLFLFQR